MANDLTPTTGRDLATMPLEQALDAYGPSFKAVLPANVPLEHFKRMVVTAINMNPDLATADRRSLFNSCVKCASDGLLPDGREAALVIFNTKTRHKLADGTYQEGWVRLAQYMPMVAGIRKRMRNSGDVLSATAEVVYRNDKFRYSLGMNPTIEHEPPASLADERGDAVGAYAVIKLKSGEILVDVMTRAEIESARAQSRAKDSLMWKSFWGEGAKKTVLRRCSKAAPQSAALESLLSRDEDEPEVPTLLNLPPAEPEPLRQAARASETEMDFALIDADGEVHTFGTLDGAATALERIFDDAKRRGHAALEAAADNNRAAVDEIRRIAPGRAHDLVEHWRQLVADVDPFGLPPLDAEAPAQNSPAGVEQREGESTTQGAPAGDAVNHGWLRQAAALAPSADLGGADWPGYADAFVALIARANKPTLAALMISTLPQMQMLRREEGEQYRRITAALAERARDG